MLRSLLGLPGSGDRRVRRVYVVNTGDKRRVAGTGGDEDVMVWYEGPEMRRLVLEKLHHYELAVELLHLAGAMPGRDRSRGPLPPLTGGTLPEAAQIPLQSLVGTFHIFIVAAEREPASIPDAEMRARRRRLSQSRRKCSTQRRLESQTNAPGVCYRDCWAVPSREIAADVERYQAASSKRSASRSATLASRFLYHSSCDCISAAASSWISSLMAWSSSAGFRAIDSLLPQAPLYRPVHSLRPQLVSELPPHIPSKAAASDPILADFPREDRQLLALFNWQA
jgi:hypothetical protein